MLIRLPARAKAGPVALVRPRLQVTMMWSQRGCFWGHQISSQTASWTMFEACWPLAACFQTWMSPIFHFHPVVPASSHCFHLQDALQRVPFISSRQSPGAMWDALECPRRAQVSYQSSFRHVAISSSSRCLSMFRLNGAKHTSAFLHEGTPFTERLESKPGLEKANKPRPKCSKLWGVRSWERRSGCG